MNNRRETKRQVITIRTMLRSNDLTADQRNAMSQRVLELRSQLDSIESQVNPAELAARREFLQKNKGMLDIFNTFWLILLSYTTDGFLSKEGYTKFHHAIEIALAGQPTFADLDQAALDADWTYDKLLYGNLNKAAFFDMLFEVIETWTEMVDPTYYAAFAWALLDAIADTSSVPPKLRPHREMRCITKVQNEASMIKNYVKNKKVRAALSIETEMMQRVPEVQKRLHDRKRGTGFDDAQQSMLEAISLQASSSGVVEFSDSDGESMHSALSMQQELLQQQSWRDELVADDDEEEEDEDVEGEDEEEVEQVVPGIGVMNDELDDESVGESQAGGSVVSTYTQEDAEGVDPSELRDQFGGQSGGGKRGKSRKARRESKSSSSGSQYTLRQNTASFLAYCSGRRETRMLLNGLYGTDASSLSGSHTGSLGSGSILDLSAMAMLPSSMATMSTDSGDDTGTLMSAADIDSPSSHSRSHSQSQSTITQQVLVIPSPTSRPQNVNNASFGNVGDKARFSQFLASGKRLGSFAKEYLQKHQMNSGVALDEVTGGCKRINSMMYHQSTIDQAMQLSKGTLHRTFSSAANLPTVTELAVQTSASAVDLSLMGKTLYVPPTGTPKTRSAYQLLSPSGKNDSKNDSKNAHNGMSSRNLRKLPSQLQTIPTGGSAESEEAEGEPRSQATSFDEVGFQKSSKKGTTSAKASGRSGKFANPTAAFTSIDTSSGEADAVTTISAAAASDEPVPSNFFNVQDTQVAPFFRPEITDELLALNRSTPKSSSQLRNRSAKKPLVSLADFGTSPSSKPRSPEITVPGTKAPQLDERAAFLKVESQPPPVEQVRIVHKARTAMHDATHPAARSDGGLQQLAQRSHPSSRQAVVPSGVPVPTVARSPKAHAPAFTRTNTSEIAAPEISVEAAPRMPSPVPLHASFESLFGHGAVRNAVPQARTLGSMQTRINTVSFPAKPPANGQNKPPGLSRSNSNLSFADSEASYDSHEHMKSMETIYNEYQNDMPGPLPTVHHQFAGDAHTSTDTIFSDNLTTPPVSREYQQRHPKQKMTGRIAASIVLDPVHGTRNGRSGSPSRALQAGGGVDLEQSVASSNAPRVKRGTNQAIVQAHHLPVKPEFATFPQGMYYSVVKNALDMRPQPNYNPTWDHTRASKAVRLSALKHPKVDMSLSLTTAPVNFASAKRIEDVMRNADHQRKILIGTIPAERMKTPTNSLRQPPLILNIRSDGTEGVNLGSALENVDFSQSLVAPGSLGMGGASQTNSLNGDADARGSPVPQIVPSFTETAPARLRGSSIPAPDALLQSIVDLEGPPGMTDELRDEMSSSAGGSAAAQTIHGVSSMAGGGGGSQQSGSQAGSAASKSLHSTATPHLLIKPVVTPKPLSSHPSPERERDVSPGKNMFVDRKGKLQVKELKELSDNKDLFEIHHNIDVSKNSGLPLATLQEHHSHIVEKTSTLLPIKHAYLTMNGAKHVLPDKIIASLITVHKNSSQYEANQSATESVFLGNSSSHLIRDSTIGHTNETATHNIPWLPGGSLEAPEHDRSNRLLGMKEKLELQRQYPGDANRGVITIRSQNAIREAFEQYVQRKLQASPGKTPLQFHQLPAAQQQQLLQQYQQKQQAVPAPLPQQGQGRQLRPGAGHAQRA